MLLALTFRLATRVAPITKSATRPIVARFVPASHAPTRSFWSSSRVEEPTKAKATATKAKATNTKAKGVKHERKKRVAAKPPKPAADTKKKVKIPTALRPPKLPATPYLLFYVEFLKKHEKHKTENGILATAVEGGKAWRALSDVEKAPYHELAKAQREEHAEALAEWFKQADPETIKQINKQRGKGKWRLHKPKSPDFVPRPLTSFMLYLKDRRAELNGDVGPMITFASESGKVWRSMTAEQKRPYQEQSKELLNEYQAKLRTGSE